MRHIHPHLVLICLIAGCSDPGKNDPDGSSSCTPQTERGVCNVFEQCGCEEGEWCHMAFDDSDCTYYEECTSAGRGPVGVEGECWSEFPEFGDCRPGLDCFFVEHMYSRRCHEWCHTDEDCSVEGRTCSVPIYYYSYPYCSTSVEAPFRACSMDF